MMGAVWGQWNRDDGNISPPESTVNDLVGVMDEHSVCEPVRLSNRRTSTYLTNKAGGIAVSPILRAYEDRGLESSTDFLSVRVYLRSETTRSMGLGY